MEGSSTAANIAKPTGQPSSEPAKTGTTDNHAAADAPATTQEPETFADCWNKMFNDIFSHVPMIYHSMKDRMPEYKDGIIHVEVLNDFQKDEYESRMPALLEYWRNHFSLKADDIVIETNTHLEKKKIIISAEDKFKNLEEQNPVIKPFLQELGLRIRD